MKVILAEWLGNNDGDLAKASLHFNRKPPHRSGLTSYSSSDTLKSNNDLEISKTVVLASQKLDSRNFELEPPT